MYLEILIRAPMGQLWERTQVPELHERWDLRFSRIAYLPRPDPDQPQRFLYATRIGFGVEIRGKGESVATREDARGCRSSALRFWSDDSRSLIRDGSGYWQYEPTADGIRFRTDYDYRTRFGTPGRVVDRLVFRPLLGWATAWSFDRLRLWLERGLDPEAAMRRAVVLATWRSLTALSFVAFLVIAPFEPVRVMWVVAVVSSLWIWKRADTPSARRCLRRPDSRP